jgi:DNA-binding transcriptional MerR regulator
VDQMSIGEFARESRLSPKALRLYDELGLLVPARVDASSGYRFYEEGQLDAARLVASLRQLEVPLAEIRVILALDPPAAAAHIASYWAGVEDDHAGRRELAAYLVDRLQGKRTTMPDVTTLMIPERHVLCLLRHVEDEAAVWALGKEFIGIMKERPFPPMEGATSADFLIYHGEVTADSDGPVEWCHPIPSERRDELAAAYPELNLRLEPAHEEAWVHVGPGGQVPAAQWQIVSDTLRAWAEERHRRPSSLGVRIIYEMPRDRTSGAGPDCSFGVPLAPRLAETAGAA